MPRWDDDDNGWNEGDWGGYDPYDDDAFADDDAETLTKTCENCGEEVYEDAEQCPYCGWFITPSTSPLEGRPKWFIAVGIIGIAAVILAMTLGM